MVPWSMDSWFSSTWSSARIHGTGRARQESDRKSVGRIDRRFLIVSSHDHLSIAYHRIRFLWPRGQRERGCRDDRRTTVCTYNSQDNDKPPVPPYAGRRAGLRQRAEASGSPILEVSSMPAALGYVIVHAAKWHTAICHPPPPDCRECAGQGRIFLPDPDTLCHWPKRARSGPRTRPMAGDADPTMHHGDGMRRRHSSHEVVEIEVGPEEAFDSEEPAQRVRFSVDADRRSVKKKRKSDEISREPASPQGIRGPALAIDTRTAQIMGTDGEHGTSPVGSLSQVACLHMQGDERDCGNVPRRQGHLSWKLVQCPRR
nr:hypothetical protein CFP56_70766 [Quercus suber]